MNLARNDCSAKDDAQFGDESNRVNMVSVEADNSVAIWECDESVGSTSYAICGGLGSLVCDKCHANDLLTV